MTISIEKYLINKLISRTRYQTLVHTTTGATNRVTFNFKKVKRRIAIKKEIFKQLYNVVEK